MRQTTQPVTSQDWPYAAPLSAVEEPVLPREKKEKSTSLQESHGERLARFRKAAGITQVELAGLLGTTQAVISDYERGIVRLHGDVIVRLAGLLGVSADELLGLEAGARQGPTRDRRLARRLQAFDSLPKRDRDALTRTIDAFLAARASTGHGRAA